MRTLLFVLSLFLLSCGGSSTAVAGGADTPAAARFNRVIADSPFVDEANLYTPTERVALRAAIGRFHDSTGSTLMVYSVPQRPPAKYFDEEQFNYIYRHIRKKSDDFILVYFSMADKHVEIRTAPKATVNVADSMCGRAIRRYISPAFKGKQYLTGTVQAIDFLAGVYDSTRRARYK